MGFFLELWAYAAARKKFWILPLLLVFLILAGLALVANNSAVAPFIYTLF